jgi:hypothetical protein
MFGLRELYAQKAAPAWSWLAATLNDPNLIAGVLCCLIGLLVTAGRLRWNERYVATNPYGIETPGQAVAGSREDADGSAGTARKYQSAIEAVAVS